MSFFQKVMSTMSSLTSVTIKGYEIEKEPPCSGGVQGQWKIHNAQKQSDKKVLASAFIIQKSQIASKEQDREETLAVYKREALSLARLRHPAILSVQEGLQDDKTQLAFVTERIECSLATALSKPELFQEHCSSDIELQMHLLELVESLLFLHNDARMAHLDINPNSIFITSSGVWKVASLAFAQQIVNKNELIDAQYIDFNAKGKSTPLLNFTSPELLQSTSKCNYNSDVFSLAMVILRLLKQRKDKISFPEFHSVEDYRNYIQRLPKEVLTYSKYYPLSLVQFLSRMLDNNPNSRPQIQELQQIDWFKDPLLQAFNILNKITTLDQPQQINFLKGLQQVVFSFEPTLLRKRILPAILDLTRFDYMSPFVLKILIEAMKRDDIFDQSAFLSNIWPKIKQVTLGKEIPAQALYDLVSNLQLFNKYISIEELQSSLVPLMIKCYECKIAKLQDIAVRATPFIVTNSDYTFTKTKILPRILNLCCDANSEVRKTSLICLYKFIDVVDRNYLCDQVLTTLDKVKQIGTDRQINQIVLKIYQHISKTLPVELIATKILPQITPFLMESQLNRSEFDEYMITLKGLLDRIQEERYKTLDSSVQQNTPLDMGLEIQDLKKQSVSNSGDQYDFLKQFNQQSKQNNTTIEETVVQQVPSEQKQSDLFGFSIANPIITTFNSNSLNNSQISSSNPQISSTNLNQQKSVIQQVQPITQQQQSIQLNSNDAFGFFNNNEPQQQTIVNNDPWATFNSDQNAKKLSQRPMFSQKQSSQEAQSPFQSQTQSQIYPQIQPQVQPQIQPQTQPQFQSQLQQPQTQQPKKVNLTYDPFADLAQKSAQEIWNQPTVIKQPQQQKPYEKKNYEAFDLI